MAFKFEKLEVWNLSLEYSDKIYEISECLPDKEKHNLRSQMTRSATSISLNIAEGSTSQSDAEFGRFIGIAIRSCVEVIACLHLAKRRGYIDEQFFKQTYESSGTLFAELQSLRKKSK